MVAICRLLILALSRLLRAIGRLLVLSLSRLGEQHLEKIEWTLRCRAGCRSGATRPVCAAPDFTLRLGLLRLFGRRSRLLWSDGQFADLHLDAHAWRFGCGCRLVRIGIEPVGRKSRDLWLFRGRYSCRRLGAGRRVGQIAQPIEFICTLERRQYHELPDFRMPLAVEECAASRRDRRVQWRTRSVRRAECQNQDKNGEKYAAYWKNAENRQPRLCITESGIIPKPASGLAARGSKGLRHFYHGVVIGLSWEAVTGQVAVARKSVQKYCGETS